MRKILPLLLFPLLFACSSKPSIDEDAFERELTPPGQPHPAIDDESVKALLEQIPSPLEISMLLKEADAEYSGAILNSPDNISRYNTNYKRALNLGIYGADLGYANIYGEGMESIRYLSSIRVLANDLNIGQFFDATTIGRLAGNASNLDSLLLITTQNFNAINQYLQGQNRSNFSLLFLVGGWVEAMSIMCEVSSRNPHNRELLEGIGEQKIVLGQMMLLLSLYRNEADMEPMVRDFEDLKRVFDAVEITHTYRESSMEVVDGVVVIKDNSSTTVSITPENAREIKARIDSIRTKIIS